MPNSRTDEFLDLYKQLEQALKSKYNNDKGHYDSVVVRYENSKDIGNLRDELNTIRELRNLIQHNPKINGKYVVEPSEELLNCLRSMINEVEHPRLAVDYGVKPGQLYKTTLGSSLMNVISVMKQRGFSQIPVVENGKLYGVLSAYTVFEFVTEQGMQIVTNETKVSAMKAYLPISTHKNEAYLFMSRKATFIEADDAFEKRDSKGRRLVAIFITEHGRPDEALITMLTPWSVVGK